MSFGDGNLHEKCEQYRRQLGAANARARNYKQRINDLERLASNMATVLDGLANQHYTLNFNYYRTLVARAREMGIEVGE